MWCGSQSTAVSKAAVISTGAVAATQHRGGDGFGCERRAPGRRERDAQVAAEEAGAKPKRRCTHRPPSSASG